MLVLKNVTFSYTDRPLFENVSFLVAPGQKVGLVGTNGAGKSTLLGLILGKGEVTSGTIETQGTIAYVPQEIKQDPILEAAGNVREYVDPEHQHQDFELTKLFGSLELSVSLDANPVKFSGGQKTKLALARALLSRPDILLLDEPTNFMDTAGKQWVMNFLANYEGAVIVISHDLKLMDQSIDKVLALNAATRTIEEYKGTYSAYVRLKAEKEEFLRKERLVQVKHIERMEKGLKKMARANRFTKAKIRQIGRIEKACEAFPEASPEIRKIKVNVPEPAKVGELPLRAKGIVKSYGERKVLKNVNFTIHRGERIALIGPNGVGKSTFIKILMGMIEPDHGEVLRDDLLSIGYYSQEFETFDLSRQVIDVFCEQTKKPEGFARAFLGSYMLAGDKIFQPVQTLSGGEKTRLSIAILTAMHTNMLILDEPTTYLDVVSQRIILESLKQYKGAMLVVSHTPEFLIELAPAKAYIFPDEKDVYWNESLVEAATEM
jgi:ATPase subunit of ABC transporter with duplicated ATPase domains